MEQCIPFIPDATLRQIFRLFDQLWQIDLLHYSSCNKSEITATRLAVLTFQIYCYFDTLRDQNKLSMINYIEQRITAHHLINLFITVKR